MPGFAACDRPKTRVPKPGQVRSCGPDPQGVQPSHAAPAFIPPSQKAAARNGSGTTHKGLRRIQKQPSPKRANQTAMKTPTAQPGAISPEAKKKGANASIATRAKPATTYLATVRASRGMGESSHVCTPNVVRDASSGLPRTLP
jgi:hypothetical protein